MKKMLIATAVLSCFSFISQVAYSTEPKKDNPLAIHLGQNASAETVEGKSSAVALGTDSTATNEANNGFAVAIAGGTAKAAASEGGAVSIGLDSAATNSNRSGLALAVGHSVKANAVGTISIAVGRNITTGNNQINIGANNITTVAERVRRTR